MSKRNLAPIFVDSGDLEQSPARPRSRKKKIAFGWYGGKFSHLQWLLPLLPDCHHYCEPFAGSAAVLINRQPSPLETYNDLDGDVVNFFRVLRDNGEELIHKLKLTPFSREEFYHSLNDIECNDVERARRFFIRARQTRTGLAQTATLGRWANVKSGSRAGMAGVVSRWLGGVEGLAEIADRLIRVQFENRPAIDVMRTYDTPQTLFYCDPPYLHSTRGDRSAYRFEMTNDEHRQFSDVANSVSGLVAISGYRDTLMDELFGDWYRFDAPPTLAHSTKSLRQESLWMNYHPGSLIE